ncbi:MAG: [FeFe] hydrogenase H-cluster radical SAM maturase HydE [Bacteroidales bacterium]|nr:[FeFe] hydrogenase H-cluster radical SAM maturase HydE [Bacteroidales bacterium]
MIKSLINTLERQHILDKSEFVELIKNFENQEISDYLFEKAVAIRQKHYGNAVYVRGLIEISNHCRNNCYYCGLRAENKKIERYRLDKETILACCEEGYNLGFRTFVLQGGEDRFYTETMLIDIVSSIRKAYPDCAITLSLGEMSYETYLALYQAGANRYLLRHETANADHYALLHPVQLSEKNRKQCLENLKKIGYQVGTGFMVGSPFQTFEHLAEDLLYIARLQPQMVGIGPFIPHHQTPFADKEKGSVQLTLFLLSILRLMLPTVLLPSTTALGTLDPQGREKGILAGANVVMPNLSPVAVRKKYEIYDNKICTGEEAAECKFCLHRRMESIGYQIVVDRGDAKTK